MNKILQLNNYNNSVIKVTYRLKIYKVRKNELLEGIIYSADNFTHKIKIISYFNKEK